MSTQTTLSPINIKDCAVSGVVIYRDRAEVKRVVHVSLKGGESDIVITGLSEAVDGDSIRLVLSMVIYIIIMVTGLLLQC